MQIIEPTNAFSGSYTMPLLNCRTLCFCPSAVSLFLGLGLNVWTLVHPIPWNGRSYLKPSLRQYDTTNYTERSTPQVSGHILSGAIHLIFCDGNHCFWCNLLSISLQLLSRKLWHAAFALWLIISIVSSLDFLLMVDGPIFAARRLTAR